MNQEIEILLEAHRQGCLIVDKDSHILLEQDGLSEAQEMGLYRKDGILSEEGSVDVSGPFPGCLQFGAAPESALGFRVLGETEHFVVFYPSKGPIPRLGPRPDICSTSM